MKNSNINIVYIEKFDRNKAKLIMSFDYFIILKIGLVIFKLKMELDYIILVLK